MRNVLLQASLSFAISCVAVGALLAQQPPPTTPESPTATPRAGDTRTVTATGCLKAEKDVPGARPNVAERAGVGEDFILTQAKLTKGAAGSSGSSQTPPSAGAAGGMGAGAMYKVSGLDDEKLRSHINQQVEVQGNLLDRTAVTGTPKPTSPGAGTAPDEVQEIRATAIKMIAATCTKGTN
jgi:hypothetical protein